MRLVRRHGQHNQCNHELLSAVARLGEPATTRINTRSVFRAHTDVGESKRERLERGETNKSRHGDRQLPQSAADSRLRRAGGLCLSPPLQKNDPAPRHERRGSDLKRRGGEQSGSGAEQRDQTVSITNQFAIASVYTHACTHTHLAACSAIIGNQSRIQRPRQSVPPR